MKHYVILLRGKKKRRGQGLPSTTENVKKHAFLLSNYSLWLYIYIYIYIIYIYMIRFLSRLFLIGVFFPSMSITSLISM